MKELAAFYHRNQRRKGPGNIPYIVHPQAVANLLISWGEAPGSVSVQTAWGHDLLEDTRAAEAEILARGGEKVLNNIRLLTRPEEMKKAQYIQSVADSASREALLVKIADRLCNTRDYVRIGEEHYAFYYLHQADALLPALEKLSADPAVSLALQEQKALESTLRHTFRRNAVRGCLLGGACGDALGAPVEFMSRPKILARFGSGGVTDYAESPDHTGSITDDTQMTLFTAEGILRAHVRGKCRGICAPESVMALAYDRWLTTQGGTPGRSSAKNGSDGWLIKEKQLFSCRAPGNACLSALEEGTVPARNDSKGCGTVMRMAPAGLFFTPSEAYHWGCRFSEITHGHPTGITAGGAFAEIISYLLEGKSLEESLDLTGRHLSSLPEAAETLAALRKARQAKDISELGEGWVAEEALAIAVFCALKHTWNFKAGVLEAVNITGDSDSTGAVTGNLLGLINGEKAIPPHWLKNLKEYDIVSRMADDLHQQFEEDSQGHVTPSWWEKYPGW